MIHVESLSVRFSSGREIAFPDFSLEQGERLAVQGANGSGKSTLLRVLAGLCPTHRGKVDGAPPRGRTVLVHQDPYLYRGSVRGNIEWALRVSGRGGDAAPWLQHLGVRDLAGRDAKHLSGGERRRVALVRALAVRPDVLLLDEPFVALDEEGADELRQLLEQHGSTLIIAAPRVTEIDVSQTIELRAGA